MKFDTFKPPFPMGEKDIQASRKMHAEIWKRARAQYFSLPQMVRQAIKEAWNSRTMAKNSIYFAAHVKSMSRTFEATKSSAAELS